MFVGIGEGVHVFVGAGVGVKYVGVANVARAESCVCWIETERVPTICVYSAFISNGVSVG